MDGADVITFASIGSYGKDGGPFLQAGRKNTNLSDEHQGTERARQRGGNMPWLSFHT
jgi:hypothetical protein